MGKFLFLRVLGVGRNTMNKLLIGSITVALLLTAFTLFSIDSDRDNDTSLSPALENIASGLTLVKSSISGEAVVFCASDFDNTVGSDKLDSIKVVTLPSESAGVLMLGELRVVKNQSIPRSNFSDLRFIPNEGTEEVDFQFSAGNSEKHALTCKMYFLDGENYSPTFVGVDNSFFSVRTYKNIAVSGSLRAYDPEGDDITYEIISSPKKGLLTLHDKILGDYTYTPMKNYTGGDSFKYVAVDKYGNRSSAVTVELSVTRSDSGYVFTDMIGDPAHFGAIMLTDKGIMEGDKDEGGRVFRPELNVSRAEFLVMAMKAAGVKADGEALTVFSDDSDIPSEYKSYISTAYDMGVISGTEIDGKHLFDPDGYITKAEACVIVDNLLGIDNAKAVPVFADTDEIPDYAYESVLSLIETGILDTENGMILPSENITRADAARILSEVVLRR